MRVAEHVRDYVSDNPDADYDTISARFGTPQQIAVSWLEEMDGAELSEELNKRRKAVNKAVIAVLLVMAVSFAAVAFFAHRAESRTGVKFVKEVKIIEHYVFD